MASLPSATRSAASARRQPTASACASPTSPVRCDAVRGEQLGPGNDPGLFQRTDSGTWAAATRAVFTGCERARSASAMARTSTSLEQQRQDRDARRQQQTVDDALRRRINTITDMRRRLDERSQVFTAARERLEASKARNDQTRHSLRGSERKVQSRIRLREHRPGTEDILDKVSRALSADLEGLQRQGAALDALSSEAAGLLVRMDICSARMSNDLRDKDAALRVDRECLGLTASPAGAPPPPLPPHAIVIEPRVPGAAEGPNAARRSTQLPQGWKEKTKALLEEARSLEYQADELRGRISKTVRQTKELKQRNAQWVNEELLSRVKCTSKLHKSLHTHLMQMDKELEQLEQQRMQTQTSLREKQAPLAIVTERIALRQGRAPAERVRDPVEEQLEREYDVIVKAIERLRQLLRQIDEEKMRVTESRMRCAEDLRHKAATLSVEKRCLTLPTPASASEAGTPLGTVRSGTGGDADIPLGVPLTPRALRRLELARESVGQRRLDAVLRSPFTRLKAPWSTPWASSWAPPATA